MSWLPTLEQTAWGLMGGAGTCFAMEKWGQGAVMLVTGVVCGIWARVRQFERTE